MARVPGSLMPASIADAEPTWRARRVFGPRARRCLYLDAFGGVVFDLHGFLPEILADGVLAEFVTLWLAASCDRGRIVTGYRHGDSLARFVRATLPALLPEGVQLTWEPGAAVLQKL
jgi:hypothetical protein